MLFGIKNTFTFSVRFLMLSYKLIGTNPLSYNDTPVMILHGLLGCKQKWNALAKTLNTITKRLVIIVDIRNHGSSPHTETHRYDELNEDIKDLYEKLGMKVATLIGHDMGGRASMAFSLMSPQSVASLLVLDMSPASSPKELTHVIPQLLTAMQQFKLTEYKKRIKAKHSFAKVIKGITNDDDLIKAVLDNIGQRKQKLTWICNVATLIQEIDFIASFPPFRGKKYEGPTLFVGGQLSDYIPPDDLPAIRELFPSTVITYIKDARHYPQTDYPAIFLENILPFLKEYR